jgi:hypothetical protein
MTFGKDIEFKEDGSMIITGNNCIICRKTKNGALIAGITSGILSAILKKNIETGIGCQNCPRNCKIIADPSLKQRYVPNLEDVKRSKNYIKNNFSSARHNILQKKLTPFLHLFRFKKVWISDDMKFCHSNKTLFPCEIGLPELIVKNYDTIGKLDLLKKIVIRSSEEIISDFLEGKKTTDQKIKEIIGLITAFGWGVPDYKKTNDKVIFFFINPPISRFGPHLRSFILNGYLNKAFGKRLDIDKTTDKEFHYSFQ